MDGITISGILQDLAKNNLRVSLPTVRGYIAKALAPRPLKAGGGAGVQSVYPVDAAAEIAASYEIIKRYNVRTYDLATSRRIANYIDKHGIRRDDPELKNLVKGKDFECYVGFRWLQRKQGFFGARFPFSQWDLYKLMNIAGDASDRTGQRGPRP